MLQSATDPGQSKPADSHILRETDTSEGEGTG